MESMGRLILSRKKNERLTLKDQSGRTVAIIEVVDLRSHVVRLGICAPKSITIYRDEIWEKIQGGLRNEKDNCLDA